MKGKLYLLLLLSFVFAFSENGDAQIITTIAGNGTDGYSGDGGPATAAEIIYPLGIAADHYGNVYFGSYLYYSGPGYSRVRKIDASGTITTYAGIGTTGYSGDGGAATAAELSAPCMVATDSAGNLYINDGSNARIRMVSYSTGIITTIGGYGTTGFSGDGGPATAAAIGNNNYFGGFTSDINGNIYFLDYPSRIRKIDVSGIITTIAGNGIHGYSGDGSAATAAEFGFITGLAADNSGNVYIGDDDYKVVRMVSSSGIISTFAGTGGVGYSGDGGPATAAQIGNVQGLSVDGADNLYIGCSNDERVRMVNTSGIISTFAGNGTGGYSGDGGPATAAKLDVPSGLALDPSGDLYISDFNNFRIRKVASANRPPHFTGGHIQYLTACENTTTSINRLLAVIDSNVGETETWSILSTPVNGSAVVSYTTTSTGSVMTPTGLSYTPTTGYTGSDSFSVVVTDAIAFDTTTIHVTVIAGPAAITGTTTTSLGGTSTLSDATSGGTWSSSNTAIATVGSTGVVTGVTGGSVTITYTVGSCYVTVGFIVVSPCPPIINTIAGTGIAGFSGDGGPATTAKMFLPNRLWVDGSGNVYFCDANNNRVRKINTSGVISEIAGNGTAGYGGDGGAATAAQLNDPTGIIVDGLGDIFIGDYRNERVRKIDPSGIITTIAGNGSFGYSGDGAPATAGEISGPIGLAFDSYGNLYFAEELNHVIRKVNTAGIISTYAGTGISGFSGDGGAATAAQLDQPFGLTIDMSNNVFITDNGNYRLRKVNTSGVINTIAGTGTAGYSGDGGAATSAEINWSAGLRTDLAGNLIFCDVFNDRIRVVNSSGIISTIAGTGTGGYSGDGGPAVATELNNPNDVAIDNYGDVLIADTYNNRIRVLSVVNHPPHFTGGHTQSFTVCENSVGDSINSLLAVIDSDIGQSETWSVLATALHGTVVASYSTTSTGSTLTPVGLYYTPTTGYAGTDSFRIIITDCNGNMDTTAIHVTVNLAPSAITGASTVCAGATITLADVTGGGAWSSRVLAVAGIGSATGIVTGVSAGADTIKYTLSTGCTTAKVVTVNPNPFITGVTSVCTGTSTTLSATLVGGVWSSGSTGVATIGSLTGIVTGIAAGISVITYTLPTGCVANINFTVNASPTAITGITSVCIGNTTTLTDGVPGGTWTSPGYSSIVSVGLSTGIVTGTGAGMAIVTYTLSGGCTTTKTVTVNPSPGPIGGIMSVCAGQTIYLTDGGGGTWSSGSPAIAIIGSATGMVIGVTAGTSAIMYTLPTGCSTIASVTVNTSPTAITGSANVCLGMTDTLSDAVPGGLWGSSDYSIAYIDVATGVVTGLATGTATITYVMPASGCMATINVTVNPAPTAITGVTSVCVGATTALFDGVSGGVWSSSAPGVATVGTTSGIVTGVSGGSTVITYSTGAGCSVTSSAFVTAAPLPITGTLHVCPAGSATLTTRSTGGVWSSVSLIVATIGSATGVVSGLSVGTTTISYTVAGGGCAATATFTVNPLPSPITGTTHVCMGSSTTLTTGPGGGTWLSGSTTIATIGSTTGILAGVLAGTTTVTYTLPTGCATSTPVTVNSLPAAIGGPGTVCIGATITLTDATGGGTWSRSNTNINIAPTTGLVLGLAAGTSTITYTLASGCYVTKTVTVNSSPGAITGTLHACIGGTTTLSDAAPGGTWSSALPTIATIGSVTGVVNGITAGTTTITYSAGAGCAATATVTVNPLPSSIGGTTTVCMGATATLTDVTAGGTWATTSTPATIGATTGVVTGISSGTALISYTLGTGCLTTTTVTVNALPTITGPTALCAGATITEVSPGGTWVSGSPAIATIGSSTGVVTGITTGTTSITCTAPTGCRANVTVTVSSTPGAISGASAVCAGATTPLTDAPGGGVWTSSTGVATVGSLSGVVTGIAAGTATISYSLGSGCTVSKAMTVNGDPAAITGSMGLCAGHTTTLSSTTTGGTWASGATGTATVGATTGIVTGIAAGTATITYTLPTGCNTTATVTVNSLPSAITGTMHVCIDGSTTLTVTTGGGIWTSSSPAIATIGSATGIVTGVAAGMATITYSLGSGCAVNAVVTVNALPAAITGSATVCAGATTTLGETTGGGTWSSSGTTIATIGSLTGIVTGVSAGTVTISYTIATGCMATRPETVSPLPAAITGAANVCVGQAITLADGTTGGAWSSSSTTTATVGPTGVVTGVTAGIATITYALPTGCMATKPVTVNGLPSAITGTASVCVGATTTLSDAVIGGAWTSGTMAIATIGSFSGVVTGVGAGTAVITYAPGAGCIITKTVTVNPLPPAITGITNTCVGMATTLSDATTGGTWSSSNALIATIGSSTGIVTGISTGGATVTYTTSNGCATTTGITVNPPPPTITGSTGVCAGQTITLSDASPGGTWSSGTPAIATVGAGTGVVTGVSGGAVTISYTATSGCATTHVVSVNFVPAITGLRNLCAWGDTVTVHDATTTGLYSSTLVSAVNLGGGAGKVTANAPGVGTVSYTVPSGCSVTVTVTTNPLPGLITGVMNACVGATTTLHNIVTGGTWSSGSPAIATVGSGTGVVTGVAAGTAYITYSLATGCSADTPVHVNTSPTMIIGYPTMVIHTTITYTDGTPGGVWSSSSPATATIGPGTGIITGVAAGTVTMTYTLSTGCITTKVLSVNTMGVSRPGSSGASPGLSEGEEVLRVLPNPNKGEFTIKGTLNTATDEEEVWLEVADMLGQVVYKNKVIARYGNIDERIVLSGQFANGMYILSLHSSSENKVFHMVISR